jgi:hypothetical protein
MKKTFPILLLTITFALFAFHKNEGPNFYRKEHYEKEKWYPAMIAKLSKEDRADAASAKWMASLSSNSHIAFEKSTPKLIERLGKINEQEIRVLFRESEKDPSVFVFVETMNNIHDLFIFNTKTEELKRVNNKGLIVIVWGESIRLKEASKQGILFYADSKDGVYRKHLYFNREENTFVHSKSCELNKGVETCKTVN